jgi:glutathione S-transferase
LAAAERLIRWAARKPRPRQDPPRNREENHVTIKLYGVPQSRSSRCLWLLEELGVGYENVPVSFAGDAQKPDFLAINPNGRIPALDDNGVVLFESLAINIHLARKYDDGRGLWPEAPDDQSRAIQWSIWAMTELEPSAMVVMMNRALLPEAQRDEAAARGAEQALAKPLGVLEGSLRDRPYLLGDAFSVADLNVAGVLSMAAAVGRMKLDATPNAAAWYARSTGRPALMRALGRRS